ncbi:MAG: nuclear transport factor 2 family protein [Actinomycetes bacterium]
MPAAVSAAEWCAAHALLAAYADAIDAGDFVAVAALFVDGALETAGGAALAAGRDEVLALYESTTKRHGDGTPRTAHLVSNVVVEPGDSDAELIVHSRFCVMQATASVPLQPVVTGRYRDVLGLVGTEWRFVRRRVLPQLWGDVSDHLTFDPRSVDR